jgi:hypothetical protein
MSDYPCTNTFPPHRTLPEQGTDGRAILSLMPQAENLVRESSQYPDTMCCGDHDRYGFLKRRSPTFPT